MKIISTLLLFTLISFQNTVISQTLDATLLEINFGGDSRPEKFIKVLDNAFFVANNGSEGRELWITDGTILGTRMVKDIDEGYESAFDFIISDTYTSVGNVLYFRLKNFRHGGELWRSDGTESGTYMVKDAIANNYPDTNRVTMFTYNDKVIYNLKTSDFGDELWISDGTEAGTHLLKDINPGTNDSNAFGMLNFNGLVYFTASDGRNGYELWKTDGTEEGTAMVINLYGNNSGLYPQNFIEFNGKFYFSAIDNNETGPELWSSDGTAAGTQMLKEIQPGYGGGVGNIIGSITENFLLFKADDGTHGEELWRTDGTVDGTIMVKDINGTTQGSIGFQTNFVSFENEVYFTAEDEEHGVEIWKSDGTEMGTVLLKDLTIGTFNYSPENLYATENHLYFFLRNEQGSIKNLYISDGTEAGTQKINNENIRNVGLVELNGKILFGAENEENGFEIWETIGTLESTKLFKDINASNGINLAAATVINDKLVFYGRNSTTGNEPYISDGTAEGTKQIADIYPGEYNSNDAEYHPVGFAKAGNKIVFFAQNDEDGIELYVSNTDGSNATLLKNINNNNTSSITPYTFLIEYNNEAYFMANDGIHGSELWKSDGTVNGTLMVKDSNPDGSSYITNPFFFQNYFCFQNGSSIYKTDGTAEGTQYVYGESVVNVLATSADYIYVAITQHYPTQTQTNEIWKIDANNNAVRIEEWPNYENITLGGVLDNKLYFAATDTATNYVAIYVTDGTPNSATQLFQTTNYHTFQDMIVCGDFLYILRGSGPSANGTKEIWRTDGTIDGSKMIISATTHPSFQAAISFDCLENRALLFNDYGNPVLYSVAPNEDFAQIHPINVVNDNIGLTYLNNIFSAGNKIMLYASSAGHGNELYSTETSNILGLSDYNTNVISSNDSSFIVYPNPTQDNITVTSEIGVAVNKLEIFSITGQKLSEIKNETSQNNITTSLYNLSSGIYLLKIYSVGSSEIQRLVKQ